MALHCIRIKMISGGRSHHEHIAEIETTDDQTKRTVRYSRAQMVAFVEAKGVAYVRDARGDVAYLGVRVSFAGTKYVQTHADGIWNDNLLALPRYV